MIHWLATHVNGFLFHLGQIKMLIQFKIVNRVEYGPFFDMVLAILNEK